MNALKALVAAMGLLIVIGIGLLGYGLMRKQPAHTQAQVQMQAQPQSQTLSALTTADGAPFDVTVMAPRNARLEQVTAAGDRIVLRFVSAEGDKLLFLDAHTGKLAGTVALTPDTH
jgi:hypothetical protein